MDVGKAVDVSVVGVGKVAGLVYDSGSVPN